MLILESGFTIHPVQRHVQEACRTFHVIHAEGAAGVAAMAFVLRLSISVIGVVIVVTAVMRLVAM